MLELMSFQKLNSVKFLLVVVGVCYAIMTKGQSISAGTIVFNVNSTNNVCGTATGTLSLTGFNATSIKWQQSPNSTGPWDYVDFATQWTLDYSVTTPTWFRAEVKKVTQTATSAPVLVTAYATATGGNVLGARTFIGQATGTLTLQGYVGNVVRWEMSGGTQWTTIPNTAGLASYNYSITSSTHFRAVIQNDAHCALAYANEAFLQLLTPGTISGASTCGDEYNINLSLNGYTGVIQQWEYSKDGGLSWSVITSTSSSASFLMINKAMQFRVLVNVGGSQFLYSPVKNVGIIPYSQVNPVTNVAGQNYTRQQQAVISGLTDPAQVDALSNSNKREAFSYLDGTGRIIQQVAKQASPQQKDIVAFATFDGVGRSALQYLPYVSTQNDGTFKPNFVTDQQSFYSTGAASNVAHSTYPYSSTIYEQSPLSRVLEQGMPGTDWQPGSGHTIRTGFGQNADNEVRMFESDGSSSAFYPANALAKTETTDEDGKKVQTFADKFGRLILKRSQLDEVVNGANVPWLETYYIYNLSGAIKFVISPKGVDALRTASWALSQSIKDQYVYQFIYDNLGRIVEKKVPGQTPMYYCYDRLDRIVLVQDANTRKDNKWIYLKYDRGGRPVMQGLYTDATNTTRPLMQSVLDGLYASATDKYYEDRGTVLHGYTNQSFPTTNTEVTAVNYYDNYDFDYNGADDYSYVNQGLSGEGLQATAFGLPTGGKRLVLGTSTWLYSYAFYDGKGRTIQVRTNNQLSTIVDNLTTNVYDFEGKLMLSKTYHNAGTGKEFTNTGKVQYDGADRISTVSSSLSQPVSVNQWNNIVSLTVTGTTLTKTGGTANVWNAGAFSYQGIPANTNGWVEFSAGQTNSNKAMGLSASNVNEYFNTIDFAILLDAAGNVTVYEKGSSKPNTATTYTTTDVFRVERIGTSIVYKKNGFVLYTSTVTSTGALYADCSFNTLSSSIKNISISFGDIQIASYQYNELGQLVDKKLHSTDGTNFLQSVDFRFSIRGWLTSINNSMLTSDNGATNDDSNDYFGMDLLYSNVDNNLGTTPYYNGNISAVKWKGSGTATGFDNIHSYKYVYDKSNRLTWGNSNIYQQNTNSWVKESGAIDEKMTYDLNGNIQTLQRNHRKNQSFYTYASETMDNLSYAYSPMMGDQLLKVTDATNNGAGFDNSSSGTNNDYTYDVNGNLLSDLNKGINSIVYNYLNKPTSIIFSDGRRIDYIYDAAGVKLSMKTYAAGGVLQTTTDYVAGVVYVNNTLSFFNSPEGRIFNNNGNLEYQYAIADNQGNTRVVFTSVNPTTAPLTATFENAIADATVFQNVNTSSTYWVSKSGANNTSGGQYVMRMNSTYPVGPSKSLKVFPGDVVNMEVWSYYEGSSGFGGSDQPLTALITAVASAFGGTSGAGGESGSIYNGISAAYGFSGAPVNQSDVVPTAHLNYILFDKDYNLLDMGWQGVQSAANFSKQKISFSPVTIKEPGYLLVYLSYEGTGTNWVYFDDLKITHTKTNVIQYNEYYPFGLQANSSWARDNTKNDFLYNQGSELNATSNWYDLPFRNYDPVLGRFVQIDPLAVEYDMFTPYHYSANNPILFNDPSGANIPAMTPANPDLIDLQNAQRGSAGGADPPPGISGEGRENEIFEPIDWNSYYYQENLDLAYAGNAHALKQLGGVSVDPKSEQGKAILAPLQGDNFSAGSFYNEDAFRLAKHNVSGDFVQLDRGGNAFVPYTDGSVSYQDYREGRALDALQGILDKAGLVPAFGEVFDGANAAIYAWRGDYVNAGISTAAMVPVLGWVTFSGKVVLRVLPFSTKALAKTAKALEKGARSVTVANKAEAEELFMALYQGGNKKGFINTTGLNAVETKGLYGGKNGTYHWDLNDTQHGGIPHLQIHDVDGNVTRIFFGQ